MGNGNKLDEVVVDDRGRILIPKKLREKLGLRPGYTARIEIKDEKLVISPPISPEEFFAQVEGCIVEGNPTMDPLKLKEIWHKE
jgi:AbrB family looped-hinge helix DNA binding protein